MTDEMEVFDNIAISSRIRLARNVEDFKFYTKQNSDEDCKISLYEVPQKEHLSINLPSFQSLS